MPKAAPFPTSVFRSRFRTARRSRANSTALEKHTLLRFRPERARSLFSTFRARLGNAIRVIINCIGRLTMARFKQRPGNGKHKVVDGQWVGSIAGLYGYFDWMNDVWMVEQNLPLRELRLDPHVLTGGDELFI